LVVVVLVLLVVLVVVVVVESISSSTSTTPAHPFRAGREAAAARTEIAAARAMVVGGDAETTQGHVGNGAALRGPDQGSYAVTVGSGLPAATSRARPREAVEGSPEREHGPRVGRGGTRNRKLERGPVDPSTAMVTDGCDELWDDDDLQGPCFASKAGPSAHRSSWRLCWLRDIMEM
jgi:hypothetical protein